MFNEAMLIAEHMGSGPPGPGIGVLVIAPCDIDRGPSLESPLHGRVEPIQLVHPLEVETQGTLFAVELDAICVLVACCEASGLETCYCSFLESSQKENAIVYRALPLSLSRAHALAGDVATGPAGDGVALFDERLFDGTGNLSDFVACNEAGHINDVGIKVAVGTRPGEFRLKSPQQRRLGPPPNLACRQRARGRSARACLL